MSSPRPNSPQSNRTRELKSRLIPRQQIHSHPLTIGGTVGIRRPMTKQNTRTPKEKKQRLPPLSTVQVQTPTTAKRLIEITPETNIESIKDPFEFIEYAKKRNLTTEFVYLYPSKIIEDAEHPTRLVVIPASEASREEFWNLSLEGLTHVKGAAVDFIPLDEWLESLNLFSRIMLIPFFKYQRQWRLFRIWKSHVNREKIQTARTSLTADLFYAHKIMRPAFIQIQRELHKLNQLKLFSVRPDGLYTLEQFTEENSKHRDVIAKAFEDFFQKMEKIVQDACEKTIESLNSPERDRASDSSLSPLELLIAHYNKTQHNVTNVFDNGPSSLQFTQKAAHRAVCSKLVRFIRLVDYVVISALRNICFMSLLEFFGVLQSLHNRGLQRYKYTPKKPIQELNIPIEYSRMFTLILAKTSDVFDSPIFRVDVSYEDKLVWKPTADEVIRRIDIIRNDYIDILFKVPRLVADPLFRPYISGDTSIDQFRVDKMSSPDLGQIIFNDIIYKETMKKQNDIILAAFKLLKFFSSAFNKAIEIYDANERFDISFLESNHITASDVRAKIHELNEQEAFLRTITEKSDVGIFCSFMKALKLKFIRSPKICLNQIRNQIPFVTKRFLDEYTIHVNKAHAQLTEATDDVASFVSYIHACEKHNASAKELQSECDVIRDFYSLSGDQDIFVSGDEMFDYTSLLPIHEEIKKTLAESQEHTAVLMPRFTKMLEASISQLHENVKKVNEMAKDPRLSTTKTTCQEAANILVVLIGRADELKELARDYNSYQAAMVLNKTKFDDVSELVKDVQMKQLMWETRTLWEAATVKWFSVNFNSIDPLSMTDQIRVFKDNAMIANKGLPENPAADDLCATITDFANLLPIVEDLKNPALQQTHMDQIESLLGSKIFGTEDFTFKKLFDLHAFNFVEQIHMISTQATNEQTLNDLLQKVKTNVESLQFTVTSFKGAKNTFILGGIDEIFTVLEDSMTIIASVRSSHYVSQLRKESDEWVRSLRQFMHCLEALSKCQTNWTFLVNILSNTEIARSLSDDVKDIGSVDKIWRNISSKINDDPSAYNICTLNPTLLDLEGANDILDRVRKNVEKFLETKRMAFPRLYFLSNGELMELISQSKDPNAILPFLPRLFDGISEVEFGMENHVPCVISVANAEGEKMAVRPIKFRSTIENWLSSIDEIVQRAVRNEVRNARGTYKEMVREDWVVSTNSQLTYVISQIEFADRVRLTFQSADPAHALAVLSNEVEQNIVTMSKIARLELSFVDRIKIQSLIAIDMLNKDITNHLIEKQAFSPNHHEWIMQMRFNWDEANKDITIDHGFAHFHYGFEFLGCNQRIVVTPSTSPFFLTLTNALHVKCGASCFGSIGSGKTETIKELSRALAIYCVVFNCSETIMVNQLSAMLRGIIQSGTWIIFSDFNRVRPEVLSIIGEDFHSLRTAAQGNLKKFEMDGFEIQLNQQCGIFMTSSPEMFEKLPDSTKVYFRPVAMKKADYTIIVEVQLIAQGFISARRLSVKLVSLIQACRDHFNRQKYYSFGMNTIKSILSLSLAMKHADPPIPEDQIIITAIRSVCLKSLDRHDTQMFVQILSNYFQGTDVEDMTDPAFVEAVTDSCTDLQLKISPYILEKAAQLHESLGMYMGVIIVGDTCVGKSTLIELLEHTYCKLSEVSEQYFPIDKSIICPKTMTLAELWGYHNNDTNEWKEGVIAKLFGETQKAEHREQWIIFDGNIDPSWIENMNSALDDTRTLSFDNLRRIKLNSQHHILFETTDLSLASPSTISRCGVIHIDQTALPWKNFISARIEQQIEPIFKDHVNLVSKFKELIELSMYSAVDFVKENISQTMHISIIGLIESFINLFCVLCSTPEFKSAYSAVAMSAAFAFSFVWGLGGYLDNTHRANFDSYVRDTFMSSMTLPGRGTIFDWSVNLSNGQWKHWSECVPSFLLTADDEFEIDPKNIKFYRVVVPTIETVRLSFIIRSMLLARHNVIIRGALGSGRRLLARHVLKGLQESNEIISQSLQFSASTNSKRIQKLFNTVFEIKNKNRIMQPPGGKLAALYIQDINTPTPDQTNSCISVELIRQLVALHGYRPPPTMEWLDVKNIALLGVGLPDGGDASSIPSRLSRHALNLELPMPDSSTAFMIVHSIWQLFFRTYDESVKNIVPKLATVSIQIYESFQQIFPATRDFPLYKISLHDLMRLTEALLSSRVETITTPQQLERLWTHEMFRTFADRFDNDSEKKKFEDIVAVTLKKKLGSDQVTSEVFSYHFGSFKIDNQGEKQYLEYHSIDDIISIFNESLNDFMNSRRGQTEKISIFEHYGKHISRVARVLQKKRGHMLLIGNSGTGKKTITRFAGYIAECEIAEFDYSFSFRDDLKALIMKCGINGKEVALILNSHQLSQPEVTDDINCIINSIDMTSFFSTDDIDKICNDLVVFAKSCGENESHENLLRLFFERATEHLHIIVCIQPGSNNMKNFLETYPSFIAMMHVDYFEDWPESAFLQFGREKYLPEGRKADEEDYITAEKYSRLSYYVYQKALQMSKKMEEELCISYKIIPALFMHFVSFFKAHCETQKAKHRDKIVRIFIGLDKLNKIELLSKQLQEQLVANEENLRERTEHDQKLESAIKTKQFDSESLNSLIRNDEESTEKQRTESDSLSKDHDREFAQVMPALNKAIAAMKVLQRSDINELKGLVEPPLPVKVVMEIICLLLNVDANWKSAVMVLSDQMFISKIISKYSETSHIPVIVLKKITETMTTDPNFEKAASGEFSIAAKTICLWEKALVNYETVYRKVEPKQKELQQFSSSIRIARNKLKANQDKMKSIEEFLDSLKNEKDQTEREVRNLGDLVNETKGRLTRYGMLKECLSSDQEKWNEKIAKLKDQTQFILGDSFLNAVYFIYLGPFTQSYRAEIIKDIRKQCEQANMIISPNYSFVSSILDHTIIDKYIQCGLSEDQTSLENAILIMDSPKAPYIIDPYSYSSKWLRNFEQIDHQLMIMKPNAPNLLRSIETYVRTGVSVLLEDVAESIDPAFDSLLAKKTFVQDGKHLIKISDRNIEIDEKFKLFITTRLHNPNLHPDFFTKTTVIMFIPTREMLEKAELNSIFTTEYPEQDQIRSELQAKLAADKRALLQNENRVIDLLRTSEGVILDDDILVDTLIKIKEKSNKLQEDIVESTEKIKEKLVQRDKLQPITNRVGLLFDSAHSLSRISYAYSYSFELFRNITRRSIANTPRYPLPDILKDKGSSQPSTDLASSSTKEKNENDGNTGNDKAENTENVENTADSTITSQTSDENNSTDTAESNAKNENGNENNSTPPKTPRQIALEEYTAKRIEDLKSSVTYGLFSIICDSLNRRHRLLFAFIVTCKVMINEKKLPEDQYRLFILGADHVDSPFENPIPEFLQDSKWNELHSISRAISSLRTLPSKIISEAEKFRDFIISPQYDLPQVFFGSLTDFETILVIKIVKPSKIAHFAQLFVSQNLGKEYVQVKPFSLESTFELTKVRTPLLFLLHRNVDPRYYIEELAVKHEMVDKLISLSFGQSTNLNIEGIIHSAVSRGEWVLIQNIHLSDFLCRELDNAISKISKNTAHPDFRLFLTSDTSDQIPISIVRKSVKKSLEQPFSIKSCMSNLIGSVPHDLLNKGFYTHLVFQIAFLHSLLNVRSKYGSLGFHQRYHFPIFTYKVAVNMILLKYNDNIPLAVIQWVLSNVTYSGGIFDPWDFRCFETFVKLLIEEKSMAASVPILSNPRYLTASDDTKEGWKNAVGLFPDEDSPEIFGLSPKCELVLINNRSHNFLQFFKFLTISKQKYPSIESQLHVIHSTMAKVPAIDDISTSEDTVSAFSEPLTTVLNSEATFLTNLIIIVNETLKMCEQSIKMQIMMTKEVNEIIECIASGNVPSKWKLVPGPLSLNGWMQELTKKVDFFNNWIRRGRPFWFNLSAFSNPRSFLYALFQRHAKSSEIEIEALTFSVSFEEQEPTELDKDGYIIGGLLCSEMEWDKTKKEFVYATTDPINDSPFLRLRIVQYHDISEEEKNKFYVCPVYRIMSTKQEIPGEYNFVYSLNLPMQSGSNDEWITHGSALIMTTDK